MTDSPRQDEHATEQKPSSGGESGGGQRDGSLGSKGAGGDNRPAPTASGQDAERQTRGDRAEAKSGANDVGAGGRGNGRDGQLGPGPRVREEQNTKADISGEKKAVSTPGAGAAAPGTRDASVLAGARPVVTCQDSPLRVGTKELQRPAVAGQDSPLRVGTKELQDAKAGLVKAASAVGEGVA